MPRNQQTNEFEAGMLRTITHKGQTYFVDGRLQECRHTEEHWTKLDVDEGEVFDTLTKEDQEIVVGEFYGYFKSEQQ